MNREEEILMGREKKVIGICYKSRRKAIGGGGSGPTEVAGNGKERVGERPLSTKFIWKCHNIPISVHANFKKQNMISVFIQLWNKELVELFKARSELKRW